MARSWTGARDVVSPPGGFEEVASTPFSIRLLTNSSARSSDGRLDKLGEFGRPSTSTDWLGLCVDDSGVFHA